MLNFDYCGSKSGGYLCFRRHLMMTEIALGGSTLEVRTIPVYVLVLDDMKYPPSVYYVC